MRLTPKRREVIDHIRANGDSSPAEISAAFGWTPGATRELMSSMLRDNQLVTIVRGRYGVLPDEPDASPDALTHEPDVAPDADESRIGKPKPGLLFAYSERDGGMVSNDVIRKRKGYTW